MEPGITSIWNMVQRIFNFDRLESNMWVTDFFPGGYDVRDWWSWLTTTFFPYHLPLQAWWMPSKYCYVTPLKTWISLHCSSASGSSSKIHTPQQAHQGPSSTHQVARLRVNPFGDEGEKCLCYVTLPGGVRNSSGGFNQL
jgi:hypothetical protein